MFVVRAPQSLTLKAKSPALVQVFQGRVRLSTGDQATELSEDAYFILRGESEILVEALQGTTMMLPLTHFRPFEKAFSPLGVTIPREYPVDTAISMAVEPLRERRVGRERLETLSTALEKAYKDHLPESTTRVEYLAVESARNWALANLRESFGVETLAFRAGFSKFHFSRIFTRCFDKTPGEFLIQERVRRACRLLIITDHPIQEVAIACGYVSSTQFAATFKRVTGFTMTQFRARGQQFRTSLGAFIQSPGP